MSCRSTAAWCCHTAAALFLALPIAAPAATAACAGSPPVAFELSIASGAMRDGKENRIDIRAHADGCVAVHRPWFLRDAGQFELRLDAQEFAALQTTVAPRELGKIDAKRLDAQTRSVWKESADDPVIYADPDADTYTLQWRDGDQSRQLVARDPQHAAQRQPKSAEVNRVAAAIGALRALASRPGKRIAEGTP
jgi:hypothetical protein